MTTASEFYRIIRARLAAALGQGEADAAARIIFEDIAGYDRKWLFMNGEREITEYMQGKIDTVVQKVEAGQPVQYAVGSALFMGMKFKVTPDVLIPRFETEGLVDMAVEIAAGRNDLHVLDAGTGCGCIAVALSRALQFARVDAVDISDAALAVARANASALKAKVNFALEDILHLKAPQIPVYDIIVSNPPYIMQSECASMDSRVTAYEPPSALFVPDSDALLYHRALAQYAAAALVPGGWLCMEINSLLHTQVIETLQRAGLADATAAHDYRGNWRYVSASRTQL